MDFLSIVLVAICVLFLLFVIWTRIRRRGGLNKREIEFVKAQWHKIENFRDMRFVIMEADKLVDYVLKKFGYRGSMADKMKSAQSLFSDVNGLWQAHKLRNQVAHEIGFTPSEAQFKSARLAFSRALRDLGVKL